VEVIEFGYSQIFIINTYITKSQKFQNVIILFSINKPAIIQRKTYRQTVMADVFGFIVKCFCHCFVLLIQCLLQLQSTSNKKLRYTRDELVHLCLPYSKSSWSVRKCIFHHGFWQPQKMDRYSFFSYSHASSCSTGESWSDACTSSGAFSTDHGNSGVRFTVLTVLVIALSVRQRSIDFYPQSQQR